MRGLRNAERACRRLFGRHESVSAACSVSSELQNSVQTQLPIPTSAIHAAANLRGDSSGAGHAQPQQRSGGTWQATAAAPHSAAASATRTFSSEAEDLQRRLRRLKGMSLAERQDRVNEVMSLAELLPDRVRDLTASPVMASRSYSTASASAPLTEEDYHHVADETLETLVGDLEEIIDDRGIETADIEFGQGVLNLRLEGQGTYVLNKQTPNLQIWLSSPVSGPFRYDYSNGRWVYRHDGHVLHDRLDHELTELLNSPVSLSRPESAT